MEVLWDSQSTIAVVMDGVSVSHGCIVGFCWSCRAVFLWSKLQKESTRPLLSLKIRGEKKLDAYRVNALLLTCHHWVVLRCSEDPSWICCGCCRCPCWQLASPFQWMLRQEATVCSRVSPSRSACVRVWPTTPPSCPTCWTTTTNRLLLSPWR